MDLNSRLKWYESMTEDDIDNLSDEELEQMDKDLSGEDDEPVSEPVNGSDNDTIKNTKKDSDTEVSSSEESPNKTKTKDTTVKITKDSIVDKSLGNSNKFILRTIDVPLISYVNITKNRSLYTDAALQAGLNHPITQDSIKGKKFYSELDHPNVEIENRIRTKLNSPIVGNITKVWRNESDQHYWGTLDIFNNDSGNLAVNLLDYGSELGISIRAEGNSVDKVDIHGQPYQEIIADDEFIIWGFDIVIFPSSQDAIIPNPKSELLESVLDSRGVSFINTTRDGLKFKHALFEGYKSSRFNNDTSIHDLFLEDNNHEPKVIDRNVTISNGNSLSTNFNGEEDPKLVQESFDLYKNFGNEDDEVENNVTLGYQSNSISTIKNNGIEIASNKDNISLRKNSNQDTDDLLKEFEQLDIINEGSTTPFNNSSNDTSNKVVMEEMEEVGSDSLDNSKVIENLTNTLSRLLDYIGIDESDYTDLDDLNELIDELYLEDSQYTNDDDYYPLDEDDDIEDEFYTSDLSESKSRISDSISHVKSRSMISHKSKLLESMSYKRPSKSNIIKRYKFVASDNPFIRSNDDVPSTILDQMGFKLND